MLQVWFSLAIATCFLMATIYYMPFHSSRNYNFAVLAHMCILVTLLLALSIKTDLPADGHISLDVIAVLLVSFQLIPILAALAIVIGIAAVHSREARARTAHRKTLPAAMQDEDPLAKESSYFSLVQSHLRAATIPSSPSRRPPSTPRRKESAKPTHSLASGDSEREGTAHWYSRDWALSRRSCAGPRGTSVMSNVGDGTRKPPIPGLSRLSKAIWGNRMSVSSDLEDEEGPTIMLTADTGPRPRSARLVPFSDVLAFWRHRDAFHNTGSERAGAAHEPTQDRQTAHPAAGPSRRAGLLRDSVTPDYGIEYDSSSRRDSIAPPTAASDVSSGFRKVVQFLLPGSVVDAHVNVALAIEKV